MKQVVVVGASLAGLRSAEALRRSGFDGRLAIIGDEPHQPYDRPPLSKGFAAGTVSPEELALRQSDQLAAEWRLGRRAVRLDAERHQVLLDDGELVDYDGLVVATGATPRRLPSFPDHTPGLHLLRTVDDTLALRAELRPGARVAIVGGGFIGAELASTCRQLDLEVTVVTPLPLMVTALGALCSAAAERARRHGVNLIEGVAVTGLCRDEGGRTTGVELDDGRLVAADVVVVAIGVRPAVEWLEGSGAKIDAGVICDPTMAVEGVGDVVAAGDVARWPHPLLGGELLRLEHWTNAAEQAAAAAKRLLDAAAPPYTPVPSFWSDQFGIRLQGVGLPGLADEVRVVDGDPAGDRFLAEYHRRGELIGALTAGGIKALLPYRRQLVAQCRIG